MLTCLCVSALGLEYVLFGTNTYLCLSHSNLFLSYTFKYMQHDTSENIVVVTHVIEHNMFLLLRFLVVARLLLQHVVNGCD